MYVNPFVAGVIATIMVELVIKRSVDPVNEEIVGVILRTEY